LPDEQRSNYELNPLAYIQFLEKSPMRILGSVLDSAEYSISHRLKTPMKGEDKFKEIVNKWWTSNYDAPAIYSLQ